MGSSNLIQVLDVIILSRLFLKPSSGYALRKDVLSIHGLQVSFGTLYPHLHILEKASLILCDNSSTNNHGKKVYSITPTGVEMLTASIRNLANIVGELKPIIDAKHEKS